MTTLNSRTPEELTEIAKRMHSGEIFSSAAVRPEDQHMLTSIFLPLMFADDTLRESIAAKPPHLVCAYMSDALPRGINSYPMFSSCFFLDEQELKTVAAKLEKIEQAMRQI